MTAAKTYALGPIDQIPQGEGRVFAVEGKSIAVFRDRNGQVYACDAHCPHRGGPLADGVYGNASVICPIHERKFNLENGESGYADCQVKTYSVSCNPTAGIILNL